MPWRGLANRWLFCANTTDTDHTFLMVIYMALCKFLHTTALCYVDDLTLRRPGAIRRGGFCC